MDFDNIFVGEELNWWRTISIWTINGLILPTIAVMVVSHFSAIKEFIFPYMGDTVPLLILIFTCGIVFTCFIRTLLDINRAFNPLLRCWNWFIRNRRRNDEPVEEPVQQMEMHAHMNGGTEIPRSNDPENW